MNPMDRSFNLPNQSSFDTMSRQNAFGLDPSIFASFAKPPQTVTFKLTNLSGEGAPGHAAPPQPHGTPFQPHAPNASTNPPSLSPLPPALSTSNSKPGPMGQKEFKIGADFLSDSEETFGDIWREEWRPVAFVKNPLAVGDLSSSAFKPLDFSHFVQNRCKFIEMKKNPQFCGICGQSLSSPSAKGGHMAKHHRDESKKYRNRKATQRMNVENRKRSIFFNSLYKAPNRAESVEN